MARIRSIKPDFWGRQQDAWTHGCALYVIQERRKGPVKIGIAEHPIRRLTALQGGNPRQISLRAIFVGAREDCREIESAILVRFAMRRMLGEWLNVSLDEVIAEVSLFEETGA